MATPHEGVTSVIIGAKKMSQLKDNLGAAEVELTGEDIARISAVTEPRDIYSNWMVERMNGGGISIEIIRARVQKNVH